MSCSPRRGARPCRLASAGPCWRPPNDPQEPMSNLDPSFTIASQLSRGLRAARPMPKYQARKVLTDLLIRVGITDPERVIGLYPHQISGGMAQRVLICGAVASDPDIIV